MQGYFQAPTFKVTTACHLFCEALILSPCEVAALRASAKASTLLGLILTSSFTCAIEHAYETGFELLVGLGLHMKTFD